MKPTERPASPHSSAPGSKRRLATPTRAARPPLIWANHGRGAHGASDRRDWRRLERDSTLHRPARIPTQPRHSIVTPLPNTISTPRAARIALRQATTTPMPPKASCHSTGVTAATRRRAAIGRGPRGGCPASDHRLRDPGGAGRRRHGDRVQGAAFPARPPGRARR